MFQKSKLKACIRLVEQAVPSKQVSCSFEPPSSEGQIVRVESKYDILIPTPIRDSFKDSPFFFTWGLYARDKPPKIYENAREGMIAWTLDTVKDIELSRKQFTERKLPKLKISREHWNTSFAFATFMTIRNGELYDGFLAIDLAKENDFPVIILDSYHKSICHGSMLSASLTEFFDQMCSLAFLVPNTDLYAQLTEEFTKPLDCECQFAKEWLNWFTNREKS